jgi:Smg protein
MFEVLVYLFENYFEANVHPDQDVLTRELFAAGFEENDINCAFYWFSALEDLSHQSTDAIDGNNGLRIYSEHESRKISIDSLSFLMFLEQASVINLSQRELMVDRLMALPNTAVTLEETKWIVLIALWKQGKAGDYLFVEDVLFSDSRPTMH